MKYRFLQALLALICLTVTVLSPVKLLAQHHDYDDPEVPIIDSGNAFCKRLSLIMKQADLDFAGAKGTLLDTTGQKDWDCNEDYKMPGAHGCTIFQNGQKTTYVAFFMTKATKEALGSSYNNLYHQLKDCLGAKYEYTDKKTTSADKLFGNTNYECEMVPNGDGILDQADMRVSIQRNPSGSYDLILEIMKYKGYYMNRREIDGSGNK